MNRTNSSSTSPQKAVQVSQLHSNQITHAGQMIGQAQLQQPNQQQQQQQLHQSQQQQQQSQALSNLLPSFFPNNLAMLPYFNWFAAQQQVFTAARCNGAGGRANAATSENGDCDDDEEDDDDITMTMGSNSLRDMHNDLDINHPESPTSSVPNNSHLSSLNSSGNHHNMSKISGSDDDRHNLYDYHAAKTTVANGNSFTSATGRCSDIGRSPDINTSAITTSATPQTPPTKMFDCKFCGIFFQDIVLHSIHMAYHSFNDVFTCNKCGEKCTDRISFFLHIGRTQHA